MALTVTSLSAACLASDTTLFITSTSTGFPAVGAVANQLMLVDGEFMYITQVPVAGQVTVRNRGSEGTAAVAHAILAQVTTSSTISDFPTQAAPSLEQRPGYTDFQMSVGANGAITLPGSIRPVTVNLVKATALASTTLAAPSAGLNGLRVTITSQTAAAHVITATSLINDGVTGAPHTTLTFAAFPGASITLEAQDALWNVVANNNVTVS